MRSRLISPENLELKCWKLGVILDSPLNVLVACVIIFAINYGLSVLGPHPLAHSDEGWSHSQAIGACPLPFSFASVRARTQDQRDILKWGALSLPTELVAQLVVRVLPISICPFGLGFELSRRRKKRAWDMPL